MRPRREKTDGGDLAQLREALVGTAAIDDLLIAERLRLRAEEEGLTLALTELRRCTAEIESGRVYED